MPLRNGAARFADTAGSWNALAELVNQAVKECGFTLHEAGRRGTSQAREGPPSAQALVRTFGTDESKIRVKLYRDTHAWCPYCHKVWLQLEEKRIPYVLEKINMNCYGDKKQSFLAKTPRGLLPAIEIDGRFQVESSVIMQLIEDSFPEYQPLLPPKSSPRFAEACRLLEIERELFGAWLSWLREVESPSARRHFERAMDEVEKALQRSTGPYFMGAEISLPDCVFASTLERVAASIFYYKGMKVKGGPWNAVNSWFQSMEEREAYKATQSDFHTHVHDLPPQIGGCIPSGTPEQRAAAAMIDGTDGRSWQLPLPPLAEGPEPVKEVPKHDLLEAATAVVHCHEGVVRAACTGTRADPAAADAALRLVVRAMVGGFDTPAGTVAAGNDADATSAAAALRWTRDRVCVPRDMSFPAARQLRAHMNWVADQLDPSETWKGVPIPAHNRRDMDPKLFWGQAQA